MNIDIDIDINLLVHDLRQLEDRIREIKRPLRQPWTQPMGTLQAELCDLAEEATALYTLRAWTRGRHHRTQPPRELRTISDGQPSPIEWDVAAANRELAESVADRYRTRRLRHPPSPGGAAEQPTLA